MSNFFINARVNKTPYYDAVVAAGMDRFMIYNKTILPIGFGDPNGEYERLIHGVSMWDVGCERQLQIAGPDAETLVQRLAARDVSNMVEGQGRYVAMCNYAGHILNDPVLLKLSAGRWWFSLADHDMLLWAEAIAGEAGMDVEVSEPDVSPLAIQGPDAENVTATLFGDDIRALKLFRFVETDLDGIPVVVCRSGWSKQGGFELFLQDHTRGIELWNLVAEAGRPWGIGPGGPNGVERVESGLFSYGTDNAADSTPFECGLGPFVDVSADLTYIGRDALAAAAIEGPQRTMVGLEFLAPEPGVQLPWTLEQREPLREGNTVVGHASTVVFSPRLEKVIGIAQIATSVAQARHPVTIQTPTGRATAIPVELPFIGR